MFKPSNLVLIAFFAAVAAFLALLAVNVENLTKETGKVTVTSVDPPSGGENAVSQTREFEIVSVLAFDTIRSIDSPRFVDSETADDRYLPSEPVIGIEIDGDARAYSVPTLSRHEIVNDVVGGKPVAITWCPLCFSAIGYSREVNGQTLEFGVSGKLINNALVMYDRQTRSLWSQFLSMGVEGEFAGVRLEFVPVLLTTWEEWKRQYPETLALHKSDGPLASDPYDFYYESDQAGVNGELTLDDRLPRKELVLGLGFDDGPKAFPHSQLREARVVNDEVADRKTAVYFHTETETAVAFNRVVDGQELTFKLATLGGREWLIDQETETLWLPFTGAAVEGPLAGKSLERIHAVSVFWFAWTDFYPQTEVFGIS